MKQNETKEEKSKIKKEEQEPEFIAELSVIQLPSNISVPMLWM